jgi:hypothetical protein
VLLRHNLALTVGRSSGTPSALSRAQTKVRVVRGAPPTLRLLKNFREPVDPSAEVQVPVQMDGLRGRCWAKWRSAVKAAGEVPVELDADAMSMWEQQTDAPSNRCVR